LWLVFCSVCKLKNIGFNGGFRIIKQYFAKCWCIFFMFNFLNNYNKEAKFDCSTGNNHICCPVAANEINKGSKKGKEIKKT